MNQATGGQMPIRMMSGTADNLGNIDLEDSQKGLPDRAYFPSSPDGSFRSSLEDSSSARQ